MPGPKIQNVERTSQATPLAEDYLNILRGQIASGQFGLGVGPLQREAGTAARQYLLSLQQRARPNTAGELRNDTGQIIGALQKRNAADTRTQAAQLREGFGASGSRFSTEAAQGEGRLRSENQLNLDQLVASVLVDQGAREQAARQFDVGAGFQLDAQTQAAIESLFNQGQGNIAPFAQAASQGIVPSDVIASPGILSQILSTAGQLGAAYITGGASLPFTSGGIPNAPNIPDVPLPPPGYGAPQSTYPVAPYVPVVPTPPPPGLVY